MTDQPTGNCVICQRRRYERANVCDPDRSWLPKVLTEIVELYALLPANLMPGQAQGQRVSGSREAPLPLRVDPLDLGMPARAAAVHDAAVPVYEIVEVELLSYAPARPDADYEMRVIHGRWRRAVRDDDGAPVMGPSNDQTGLIPVATILDGWVRDWVNIRDMRENLPNPTVVELARWMLNRMDWACDSHPAIDEVAAELKAVRHSLRAVAGTSEIRPEHLDVPCRRCDLMDLHRLPGEDRVECDSCGDLLTEEEYLNWVRLLAAHLHESAS